MTNRRTRRDMRRHSKPLSRAVFQRELTKVVDGDPSADPNVREFWNQTFSALGGQVALPHRDGIEILRKEGRADG